MTQARDKAALALSFFLVLILLPTRVQAEQDLPPQAQSVGFDQRLDEQVPLELEFKDEAGQTVKLGDYFGSKPVILVLAYYRCPKLCHEVLNGLVKAMIDIPFTPGKDYEIVTVSFDPAEKPELAAAKKKTYVERYGRPGAQDGWHFLTGEQPAIECLTQAVGFRYVYDEKYQQFIHAAGIMIVTPQGKLSRYLRDVTYAPKDLRFSLEEASEGKIGSVVDQVLLLCFHYDPKQGKYGPAYMNMLRLGGAVILAAVGTLWFALMWRERRKARSQASEVGVQE